MYLVVNLLLLVALGYTWRHLFLARSALATLRTHTTNKDTLLDYVLRYYGLHVDDPFVTLPGFDEKRCHHCHWPVTEGHHPTCIWQVIRPVTAKLYSETKAKP